MMALHREAVAGATATGEEEAALMGGAVAVAAGAAATTPNGEHSKCHSIESCAAQQTSARCDDSASWALGETSSVSAAALGQNSRDHRISRDP